MSHSHATEKYAFLFLLSLLLLIGFYILYPFLAAVIFSMVFTVLFFPLHEKYLKWTRGRENLASFLSVLSVVLLLILPVASILTLVTTQLTALLTAPEAFQGPMSLSDLLHKIQDKIPYWGTAIKDKVGYNVDLMPILRNGLSQLAQTLAQYSPRVIMTTANFFVHVSIMVIAMFYLFRDGQEFFNTFIRLTPVKDKYERALAKEIKVTIQAIFYGSFLTSIVQATFSTLGFYFLGIEGFLVWGILTFLMSFIPLIGTGGVFVPLVIGLFLKGESSHALGLLVYGIVIIGSVDNVLKPLLMRQKNLHPMFLFLSVFGGMAVFGAIGLFLGPMFMAMLTSVVSIYEKDFVEKGPVKNEGKK